MTRIPKRGSATCDHCGTIHTGLPVEIEGAGDHDAEYLTAHVVLDTVRCQGSDSCIERLCECCCQLCPLCDLPTCEEHLKVVDGVKMCEVCAHDQL